MGENAEGAQPASTTPQDQSSTGASAPQMTVKDLPEWAKHEKVLIDEAWYELGSNDQSAEVITESQSLDIEKVQPAVLRKYVAVNPKCCLSLDLVIQALAYQRQNQSDITTSPAKETLARETLTIQEIVLYAVLHSPKVTSAGRGAFLQSLMSNELLIEALKNDIPKDSKCLDEGSDENRHIRALANIALNASNPALRSLALELLEQHAISEELCSELLEKSIELSCRSKANGAQKMGLALFGANPSVAQIPHVQNSLGNSYFANICSWVLLILAIPTIIISTAGSLPELEAPIKTLFDDIHKQRERGFLSHDDSVIHGVDVNGKIVNITAFVEGVTQSAQGWSVGSIIGISTASFMIFLSMIFTYCSQTSQNKACDALEQWKKPCVETTDAIKQQSKNLLALIDVLAQKHKPSDELLERIEAKGAFATTVDKEITNRLREYRIPVGQPVSPAVSHT